MRHPLFGQAQIRLDLTERRKRTSQIRLKLNEINVVDVPLYVYVRIGDDRIIAS